MTYREALAITNATYAKAVKNNGKLPLPPIYEEILIERLIFNLQHAVPDSKEPEQIA